MKQEGLVLEDITKVIKPSIPTKVKFDEKNHVLKIEIRLTEELSTKEK